METTLYKAEKDKADKIKEEQAEAPTDNEAGDKPDENKEGTDKENGNNTDENKKDKKLSIIETDIANHYLHRIYPNYPLP